MVRGFSLKELRPLYLEQTPHKINGQRTFFKGVTVLVPGTNFTIFLYTWNKLYDLSLKELRSLYLEQTLRSFSEGVKVVVPGTNFTIFI